MHALGEAPDKVIAAELGISISTVRRRRIAAGISAYREIEIDWTKIDPDLFTKSCRELAEEHGVSPMSISNRRKIIGVNDE